MINRFLVNTPALFFRKPKSADGIPAADTDEGGIPISERISTIHPHLLRYLIDHG